MKDLGEIVDAVNAEVSKGPLGSFYVCRRELKGRGHRYQGLFQPAKGDAGPLSGYSFHHGGRRELQFNLGFEDERFLRYGVAFSLQPGRNFPDPVGEIRPRIERFNSIAGQFKALKPLKMWLWRRGVRFGEKLASPVPEDWIESGSFIFIGERADVAHDGVTPVVIDRISEVLASLLPLYEAVEGEYEDLQGRPRSGTTSKGLSSLPTYVARIAYNSTGWRRPAAAGEVVESGNTYRAKYGFAHEDWLFRDEWQLDGWRYAFVQGVNFSRAKLLREDRPFNLRLFTMPEAGARYAVAEIDEVECLDDESAAAAVAAFSKNGWLAQMRAEVQRAGGEERALGDSSYAPHVLNVRYRLGNMRRLDASEPLSRHDPISKIKRYSLCQLDGAMDFARPAWKGRSGSTTLPTAEARERNIAARQVFYSPEHIRLQEALGRRLLSEFPGLTPVFEQDFVDATLRTTNEILLFEVKSHLNPLSVVREALGQLLEYAYHPRRKHDLPLKLVIVGRRELEGDDLRYFEAVRDQFGMPLEYWALAV